jgi:hypothetical protein
MPHGKGFVYGWKQAANQVQIDETGSSFLGLVP